MRIAAALVVVLTCAWPAGAQEPGRGGARAVAFDSVVGVQDFWADGGSWPAQVVFDVSGTVEVARGVQATFRPKIWRIRGDWRTLVDQASVRYEFRRASNWRVEAGRFPSPVGLGMTENRPNLNPGVVWYQRPYYQPLPSLGTGAPRLSLVSAVYPYGAQVSTSTGRWDARAAVLDRAPIEFWVQDRGVPHRANVVLGGGLTPRQGIRVGAASAVGRLPAPAAALAAGTPGWSYRLLNVEAEAAVAYTKISAEWTDDRIDLPGGPRSATGWAVQGRQTLTPRLFAHARVTHVSAPAAAAGGTSVTHESRAVDTTVGFLATPEIVIRVGHAAIRSFTTPETDHQVGLSMMWSRRWW